MSDAWWARPYHWDNCTCEACVVARDEIALRRKRVRRGPRYKALVARVQMRRWDHILSQARNQARRMRYLAAVQRAEGLWLDALTPGQRRTYEMYQYIDVAVPPGDGYKRPYCYRIHTEDGIVTTNIQELEPRRRRWCIHIDGDNSVPYQDHWLAQKLWIEHNHKEFRRVAQ